MIIKSIIIIHCSVYIKKIENICYHLKFIYKIVYEQTHTHTHLHKLMISSACICIIKNWTSVHHHHPNKSHDLKSDCFSFTIAKIGCNKRKCSAVKCSALCGSVSKANCGATAAAAADFHSFNSRPWPSQWKRRWGERKRRKKRLKCAEIVKKCSSATLAALICN